MLSASTRTPESLIARSGMLVPRPAPMPGNGTAPITAFTYSPPSFGGCASSMMLVMASGADHALAADSHDLAGDGVGSRAGEVGDGLGDVDGLPALVQR